MYEIHHAPKELDGNIPVVQFTHYFNFVGYLEYIAGEDTGTTVYIFTYDHPEEENKYKISEVFVTSDFSTIISIVKAGICRLDQKRKFFLFEYESYEEAYKTALDLKELSPLCWEQTPETLIEQLNSISEEITLAASQPVPSVTLLYSRKNIELCYLGEDESTRMQLKYDYEPIITTTRISVLDEFIAYYKDNNYCQFANTANRIKKLFHRWACENKIEI